MWRQRLRQSPVRRSSPRFWMPGQRWILWRPGQLHEVLHLWRRKASDYGLPSWCVHYFCTICNRTFSVLLFLINCFRKLVLNLLLLSTAPNGEQELYNPTQKWCDYPERVDCGERPICKPDNTGCVDGENSTLPPNTCQTRDCSDDG